VVRATWRARCSRWTLRARSSASSASRRASTARTRSSSTRAGLLGCCPPGAGRQMVVDDPAGLHPRVDGRRPDEAEACLAQLFESASEPGVLTSQSSCERGPGPSTRYDQTSSGSVSTGLAQRDRRPGRWQSRPRSCRGGARSRRRRAAARRQPPEPGHALRLESGQTPHGVLAFAQDRHPREPGLEALEAEALVEPAFVHHRPTPLLVVVAVVRLVGALPAAFGPSGDRDFHQPVLDATGKVSDRGDGRQ